MFSSVTLQQLRVFAAAAREGSFVRAADALSVSEPNVSMHVQALERALGVTLFERSRGRRQLYLTDAGRILLETVREVQQSLDGGARALETLKMQQATSVRVGVGVYFGGYLMPRLQDRFRREHPEINVRVEVFNEPVPASERVLQGKLDMLIGGAAVEHPRLVSEPFPGFDCVLVGPPGHRLARMRQATFEDLKEEEFVLRVRTAPSWRTLEAMAARHNMTLRVALESPDMDSEVQAVSSGVGLGVMPWETVAARINAGQLVVLDVEGLPIHAQRYLIYRRGPQSSGFLAFKEFLDHSADILQSGLVA